MSTRGWVFVTGASTGIGRAAVDRLAADGWGVVAGVRKEADRPPSATDHVVVDIADTEQVSTAAKRVAEISDGRLVGLVNNAGISVAGPFEALTIDDYRRQFDVNFFGHLDVTQRLLPSLLANRGRIITVGSIGGRLASPFLGAYNASKFAIRGWTDALRLELAPHAVGVTLVEPGAIATEIWGKGNAYVDDVLARMPQEQATRYEPQFAGARRVAAMVERNAIGADKVASAIAGALTARRAPATMVIGRDARLQAALALLPVSITDRVLSLATRPRRR